MTIKGTRIVENTWICTSCQSKQLGRHMKCQACGSAKESNERDIVPDPSAAQTVTDPELLKKAKDGPDWVCEYCQGRVRNAEGKCSNCAASRTPYMSQERIQRIADEAAKDDGEYESVSAGRPPGWKPIPPFPPPTSTPVKVMQIASIATAVIAGVAAMVWALAPHEVDANISGITWAYTADLHQKTQKHGTDWNRPSESSAFNVSCNSKYYGDEDCHPHNCNAHQVSYDCNCTSYDCNCRETCRSNNNGFSTCSTSCSSCSRCSTCYKTEYDTCYDRCSVYKNWCEYDYYAWPTIASLQTTGTTHETKWPALEANGPNQRLDKTERYSVQFVNGEDSWTFNPVGLVQFERFTTGKTWKLKVRHIGSVEPLEEVSANTRPR